jgi:hypothetical protein
MFRYVPANVRIQLGQVMTPQMPVAPDRVAPALVPAKKWLLNFAILAAGVGIGYLGIKSHKEPLGILAIQAGGSVVGAALVLLALDLGYPEGNGNGLA